MLNNYELGISLLKNNEIEKAKENFTKAYKNGNKKALYHLRKIRNTQETYENKLKEVTYIKEKSKLGYEVEIPTNWIKTESIDDKCFDTIVIDKFNEYIYNVKTQAFLIEIPEGCIDLISIDGIISHMGNISEIKEHKSSFCEGKLIKSECIDGTINYTLMTTGKKGIYQFKISIDQFLEKYYEEIKEHILNSFKVIE